MMWDDYFAKSMACCLVKCYLSTYTLLTHFTLRLLAEYVVLTFNPSFCRPNIHFLTFTAHHGWLYDYSFFFWTCDLTLWWQWLVNPGTTQLYDSVWQLSSFRLWNQSQKANVAYCSLESFNGTSSSIALHGPDEEQSSICMLETSLTEHCFWSDRM